MATQEEKIKKYEDELKSLKDTLTKYGDMFNEDGQIDSEEQKQLDSMQAIIMKAEDKLAKLKGEVNKKDEGNDKNIKENDLKSILDKMNSIINEHHSNVLSWAEKIKSNNSNIA
jgi:hypothetical protein